MGLATAQAFAQAGAAVCSPTSTTMPFAPRPTI
jgi:hypothetical protein